MTLFEIISGVQRIVYSLENKLENKFENLFKDLKEHIIDLDRKFYLLTEENKQLKEKIEILLSQNGASK